MLRGKPREGLPARTSWEKSGKLFGISSPKLSIPVPRHFHRFFSDQKEPEIIFTVSKTL